MLCSRNGFLALTGGRTHSHSGRRGVDVGHRRIYRDVDGGHPGVGNSQGRISGGATVGDYVRPLGGHFVAVGASRQERMMAGGGGYS